MDTKNNFGLINHSIIRTANSQAQKLIKDQSNPIHFYNSFRPKKKLIKKIKRSVCLDSSYYLG